MKLVLKMLTTLNHLMNVHGDDWGTIFQEYQKERKPNADAIAELSYRNFMEMSSKTASVDFQLRKKIEAWFSSKHPELWLPLYSRVTFSNDSYAEALAMGDMQATIMDKVMQLEGIHMDWNSERVESFIIEELKK